MKPGFYLKCGAHFTCAHIDNWGEAHVTYGSNGTRFETRAEAETMRAALTEKMYRPPYHEVFELLPKFDVGIEPAKGLRSENAA